MTQRQKDNLALPSAEHQAIESSQAGVETWKYKAKNSLMYYPEGEQAAWAGLGVWIQPPRRVSLFASILGLRGVLVCLGQVGLCGKSAREGGSPQLCSGFVMWRLK